MRRRVKIDGKNMEKEFNSNICLRQCCALSRVLFHVFTDAVPLKLNCQHTPTDDVGNTSPLAAFCGRVSCKYYALYSALP
jgi:hypothetical protein